MCSPLNWLVGWAMILAAFLSGAGIGLFIADERFAGGYGSWRRRMLRLGHIALAALGFLNLIFAMAPLTTASKYASILLIVGGVTMPLVCFASAVRQSLRHFFVVPVLALILVAVFELMPAVSQLPQTGAK